MKSGPSVLCCRGLRGYNFLVRMEVLSRGGHRRGRPSKNRFGALVGRLVNWPVLTQYHIILLRKNAYMAVIR